MHFQSTRARRLLSALSLLPLGLLPACGGANTAPNTGADESPVTSEAVPAPVPEATQKRASLMITAKETTAAAPSSPIVLGYFTNWAHTRKAPCEFQTSDVNPNLFTHINYSFASVGASESKLDFSLIPSSPEDTSRLYAEVNALKEKNPALKTFLSVGGWAFNDKPTEWVFSEMASTAEKRGSFIRQSLEFLRAHGFDGLDIDWEFPGAPDRGGRPEDRENFTSLLREFRAQMHEEAQATGKPELLLTIASPPGPHYYQYQELGKFHPYLNWINVMTYDYHGTWEMKTGANTPLTDDELSLQKTIEAYSAMGVPKSKMVLGIATYSRGWSGVKTPAPGSPAEGNGPPGPCDLMESPTAAQVEALIKSGKYQGHWDEKSQTPFAYNKQLGAYLTYDNKKSIGLKMDFLKEQKLAGAMFWAIDLDDYKNGYPIIQQVSDAVLGPVKK